jgi:hypothetical protein
MVMADRKGSSLGLGYSGGDRPGLAPGSLFVRHFNGNGRAPTPQLPGNLAHRTLVCQYGRKSICSGVDNPKQQDIVVHCWFAPPLERRKREHGANPWLPRSGKQERTPSPSTGLLGWEATASRSGGFQQKTTTACKSEDLPAFQVRLLDCHFRGEGVVGRVFCRALLCAFDGLSVHCNQIFPRT